MPLARRKSTSEDKLSRPSRSRCSRARAMQQPRFPSPSRKSRENGNAAVVDSPGISKPTPTNSPVAGTDYVTELFRIRRWRAGRFPVGKTIVVKRIFFICAFLAVAELSFAARAGGTSQPMSELYAIASDGTPLPGRPMRRLARAVAGGPGDPWRPLRRGDPEDAGVDGSAQDLANAGFIALQSITVSRPPAPSRVRPRRADFLSNTMMCIWPCRRPATMPVVTDRWGLSVAGGRPGHHSIYQ